MRGGQRLPSQKDTDVSCSLNTQCSFCWIFAGGASGGSFFPFSQPGCWLFYYFCFGQEPLLKSDLGNPALGAGYWSQLCPTCKVGPFVLRYVSICNLTSAFLHGRLFGKSNLKIRHIWRQINFWCFWGLRIYSNFSDSFWVGVFLVRLWGPWGQSIAHLATGVWSNLIIIALGYLTVLERFVSFFSPYTFPFVFGIWLCSPDIGVWVIDVISEIWLRI